jgi:transposase
MQVTCGIDWAQDHHDIALVAADGTVIAQRRIGNDAAGFAELLAMLAEHDSPDGHDQDQGGGELVPVAIETSRGLLVACLQATGRDVYAINPLAAARYRERYRVSGAKSDALDAIVLANILRTDRHAHRALPRDSEQARAVAVLARAQQHAVWTASRSTTSCGSCSATSTQPRWPPSPAPDALPSTAQQPARS